MTAISSYIRHLIVTAVLLVVERTNLPVEGAQDAASAIALLVIGTATWAVVKYAPEIAKRLGFLLLPLAAVLILPSCADSGYPLTGSLSYLDAATGAKGGLVFLPGQPPRASVRIPVYDEQGNLIGVGEIRTEIEATK